jgi:hypothetical protein
MIRVFKEIRNQRGPLAHEVGTDEWNDIYFTKQRKLMIDAYGALRSLRQIFANHPLANSISVPDWLYKGKIRTLSSAFGALLKFS